MPWSQTGVFHSPRYLSFLIAQGFSIPAFRLFMLVASICIEFRYIHPGTCALEESHQLRRNPSSHRRARSHRRAPSHRRGALLPLYTRKKEQEKNMEPRDMINFNDGGGTMMVPFRHAMIRPEKNKHHEVYPVGHYRLGCHQPVNRHHKKIAETTTR